MSAYVLYPLDTSLKCYNFTIKQMPFTFSCFIQVSINERQNTENNIF